MVSGEKGQESVKVVCVHRIIHTKKRNRTRNCQQVASGERSGITWKGRSKVGEKETQKNVEQKSLISREK